MSYAFDDGEVATWLPGMPFPDIAGHQIMAHNAAFERLIFWYVLCPTLGIPEPSLEQFCCTAAQARANCLPGSLEDVGRAVSSKMKKDHRGSALIRLLSVPRKDGTFNDDPTLMAEFFAYCEQDVRAMREISKSMRPLSDEELADYHVNERINDRGVLVDTDLCRAAIGYAEAELIEIQEIVREVSNGELASVRSPKMRQWVQDRVGPEAVKLMWTGEKYSIDKTVRANLLTLGPDEVPADVAEVIQCADDLWASSVAKFKRLAELADVEDRRVRGAFVFAGGSATGRAASYGAQVHNFTRKTARDPAAVRHAMVRGHKIVPNYGKRVTDVLKGMLRPALIPAPGNVFVVADWNAIEGRVNPWLSNCPAGEAKLDDDGVSYLKASWKPAADATEWPRARLWRGLAVENITQATANDILRHSMRELERLGWGIVLTIHDEIVLECPTERAAEAREALVRVMCAAPDWALGLPLAVETNVMSRYGKG